MEDLVNDKEFQKKLNKIPAHLQATFLSIMDKMMQRESEILLEFIGQSRKDMSKHARDLGRGQKELKSEAQNLEKRIKFEEEEVNKEVNKVAPSEPKENPNVKNTPIMELYFKQRARRKARSRGEVVSDDDDFDVTQSSSRLSVASTQSIPTPVVTKTIEELRDELFQNLNTADVKMQEERQRQTELLEFLKDVKSKKKTDKAHALLSEAKQSEKKVAEEKEAQDKKLREKIDEKKKKYKRRNSYKRKSVGNIEEGLPNGLSELKALPGRRNSITKYQEKLLRKMSITVDDASTLLKEELKIVDETKKEKSKRRGSRKSKKS